MRFDLPLINVFRDELFLNKDAKRKALSSFYGGQLKSVIEILSHAAGYQRIVCVFTVWNEGAVKLDKGYFASRSLPLGGLRILDRNAREDDECI